jgi:hypothetical protein
MTVKFPGGICSWGFCKKGNGILVKLTGKMSISHYIGEVANDFHGYEYEIRYYKWLEDTIYH